MRQEIFIKIKTELSIQKIKKKNSYKKEKKNGGDVCLRKENYGIIRTLSNKDELCGEASLRNWQLLVKKFQNKEGRHLKDVPFFSTPCWAIAISTSNNFRYKLDAVWERELNAMSSQETFACVLPHLAHLRHHDVINQAKLTRRWRSKSRQEKQHTLLFSVLLYRPCWYVLNI